VEGGRLKTVSGDKDNSDSQGFLCAGFQPLRTAIASDCGQSFQLIADSIPRIADR